MSMETPTIAAIVCVRNGEAFIADALESIRCQTRPADEIIVVDDGSTDNTSCVVRREQSGAVLIECAHSGPATGRNLGASIAKSDLLAFLDADDLWPPHRTRVLIDALSAHPSAGMVCGRTRIQATRPGVILDERLRRADGTHIPFLFPSGLIRRSLWQVVGGMDPAHEGSEDVDLYLRMVEAGTYVAYADAETLIYRLHGGNRSRDVDFAQAALFGTLRAALVRRRRELG